jgi:hypothetical protein
VVVAFLWSVSCPDTMLMPDIKQCTTDRILSNIGSGSKRAALSGKSAGKAFFVEVAGP